MSTFTDSEIDTLELPKEEEKKEKNIIEPDDKNIVKLVGNKNIVSILTSQFFAEKECDAIVKETVKELWVDSCLLYTSPSPRDNSGSRMPSSA